MEMKNLNNQERGQEMTEFEKMARENFSRWADSLLTKDPKKVAELYSEDCTFLPTMSPDFKIGASEAEGYFEHFLQKNPEGNIVSEKVQPLGQNAYLHSGMYNFKLGENDNRNIAEARFSFAWEKEDDGKWKIIHHHSSVKP